MKTSPENGALQLAARQTGEIVTVFWGLNFGELETHSVPSPPISRVQKMLILTVFASVHFAFKEEQIFECPYFTILEIEYLLFQL